MEWGWKVEEGASGASEEKTQGEGVSEKGASGVSEDKCEWSEMRRA